jgi:hypothetical protein
MADSHVLVEATITAQNTFTDGLLIPAKRGLHKFRIDIKGSSTFTGTSIVSVQVKGRTATGEDADADYMDAGQIEPDDEDHTLIGEVASGCVVRAGCKTGEFQASDEIKIRLTRV